MVTTTWFIVTTQKKTPWFLGRHRFLDCPKPLTAVFTTPDLPAAGTLQALYKRSRRVPEPSWPLALRYLRLVPRAAADHG